MNGKIYLYYFNYWLSYSNSNFQRLLSNYLIPHIFINDIDIPIAMVANPLDYTSVSRHRDAHDIPSGRPANHRLYPIESYTP